MKPIRTAVAAAALVAALAGCGGTPVSGSAAPQAAPTPAPTTAIDPAVQRQEVEAAFRDYYEALRARDFTGACRFHAAETNDRLIETLRNDGITAETCEEALTAVYAIPGNAETVEAVGSSATIEDVTVNGDEATITWSADVNGTRDTATSAVRRVDGAWRLVDAGT